MLAKRVERLWWFRAVGDTVELERVSTACLRLEFSHHVWEHAVWYAYLRTAYKSVVADVSTDQQHAHL
jgi:hypothetical protein